MALYMDIHTMDGPVGMGDVAQAHAADLQTQEKYGVKYLKYWYNAESGQVFCLVEAPDKDAAVRVHQEGHGLVADEIFEVVEGH